MASIERVYTIKLWWEHAHAVHPKVTWTSLDAVRRIARQILYGGGSGFTVGRPVVAVEVFDSIKRKAIEVWELRES